VAKGVHLLRFSGGQQLPIANLHARCTAFSDFQVTGLTDFDRFVFGRALVVVIDADESTRLNSLRQGLEALQTTDMNRYMHVIVVNNGKSTAKSAKKVNGEVDGQLNGGVNGDLSGQVNDAAPAGDGLSDIGYAISPPDPKLVELTNLLNASYPNISYTLVDGGYEALAESRLIEKVVSHLCKGESCL